MSGEVRAGIGLGNAVAAAISYGDWHSVGWCILDAFFGWFYVLYHLT